MGDPINVSGTAAGGGANYGAMAGMAIPFLSQAVGFGFSQMAASKAHDRSKNMITRMPLYLKAAGINPLYAYGGGGAKAPNVPMASTPGNSAKATDMAQLENLAANTEAAYELARKNFFQADQASRDADLKQAQTDLLKTQQRMVDMDLAVRFAQFQAQSSDVGQALLKYGTYADMAGAMMGSSAKGAANLINFRKGLMK